MLNTMSYTCAVLVHSFSATDHTTFKYLVITSIERVMSLMQSKERLLFMQALAYFIQQRAYWQLLRT